MSKVTLGNVGSGYKTAASINANNDRIEAAFENTLSRNGESPNEMNADLDMNGRRIQNLPNAINPREPITLAQANSLVDLDQPLTSDLVDEFLDEDDLVAKLESCAENNHGDTGYYKRTEAEGTVAIVNWNKRPGEVERYGSNTTPGTTPMRAAFLAAITQNEHPKGAPIVSGYGPYAIEDKLEWCSGGQRNKVWYANGTRIYVLNNTRGLVVGPIGSSDLAVQIEIIGHLTIERVGSGAGESGSAGFLFQHLHRSNFHFSSVGFRFGYKIAYNGSSNAHNNYYLGNIRNNYTGFEIEAEGPGYSNQNNHWGGTIANSYAGNWALDLSTSANTHRWWGTSFELPNTTQALQEGFVRLGGTGHEFLGCRFEGAPAPSDPDWNGATINQNWIVITDVARGYVIRDCYGIRSAYITGRGRGGKIIGADEDEFTSDGGGAMLTPMFARYQSKPNNGSVLLPNARIWELYAGSGSTGGLEVGGKRTTGQLLKLVTLGSIVSVGSDTQNYMCIDGHTSDGDSEPGEGVDWEDYWIALPSGADSLGASAWATDTAYTAPDTQFKIGATGQITTNQLITHSAVSGTAKLLRVYDEETGDPYYVEAYPTKA